MRTKIMAAALCLAATSAHADLYGGIGLSYNRLLGSLWQGQTDTAFDQAAMAQGNSASEVWDTKNSAAVGGRAFFGSRIRNTAIEVGYTLHGTFKSDTSNRYGYGVGTYYAHSFDLSALHYMGRWFVRGGVHSTYSEVSNHTWVGNTERTASTGVRSSGPLLGVGYQYGALRFEFTRYFGVGLTDVTGKHSIDSLGVSLTRRF